MSQFVMDQVAVIPSAAERPPINFNPHRAKPFSGPSPDIKTWSATEAAETLRQQQRVAAAADTEQITHSQHDPFNPAGNTGLPYPEPVEVMDPQPVSAPAAPAPLPPKLVAIQNFMAGRVKVLLELADGTFYMPVAAARESEHAVFLFLVNDETTLSFIPKLGTELKLTFKADGEQRTRAVYYPGTQIPVDELGQIIIAFIKKDG